MRAMGTEVTLDRYAQVRAEMEAGVMRDEALTRAGLSVDEWAMAQRTWLERMSAEIARGRFELTNRYAQAFVACQQALAAPKPVLQASRVEGPAAGAPQLDVATKPVEAKPTFPAAGAAAEPPPPAQTQVRPMNPMLAGTMAVDVSAFGEALPFQAKGAPAAPLPPPTPAPPVKRAPAALSGTSMGFVAPKGPALPFQKEAPPAPEALAAEKPPAPGPPMPAVKRAPAALSGTSMAVVMPKGPALPFATGASPEGAPPPASASPPPPGASALPLPAPAVKRAPAALSGTSMGFVAPKGPALPFQKDVALVAPAGPQGGAPPAAPPPMAVPAAPAPAVGAWPGQPGPPVQPTAPAPAGPPAPPDPAAAATLPVTLTLEQYASLCVELSMPAAKADEVLRRYALTMEQGRIVDAHWKAKVAAEPAARAAYDRAYAAYRSWLASAQGKSPPAG